CKLFAGSVAVASYANANLAAGTQSIKKFCHLRLLAQHGAANIRCRGDQCLSPLSISSRCARKNLAQDREAIERPRKAAVGCRLDYGFDYLLAHQTDVEGRFCEFSELALESHRRECGKCTQHSLSMREASSRPELAIAVADCHGVELGRDAVFGRGIALL